MSGLRSFQRVWVCIYTYIQTDMHVCMQRYIYGYAHIYIYVYKYGVEPNIWYLHWKDFARQGQRLSIYLQIYANKHTCICTFVYTYTHKHTHKHTHNTKHKHKHSRNHKHNHKHKHKQYTHPQEEHHTKQLNVRRLVSGISGSWDL